MIDRITREEFDALVNRVQELEESNDLMLIALAAQDTPAPKKGLTFLDLKIGDRVRFSARAKPKYLIGEEATVVSKKQVKVGIKLDRSAGRFSAGVEIGCPLSILEKL